MTTKTYQCSYLLSATFLAFLLGLALAALLSDHGDADTWRSRYQQSVAWQQATCGESQNDIANETFIGGSDGK